MLTDSAGHAQLRFRRLDEVHQPHRRSVADVVNAGRRRPYPALAAGLMVCQPRKKQPISLAADNAQCALSFGRYTMSKTAFELTASGFLSNSGESQSRTESDRSTIVRTATWVCAS